MGRGNYLEKLIFFRLEEFTGQIYHYLMGLNFTALCSDVFMSVMGRTFLNIEFLFILIVRSSLFARQLVF